MSAPNDPTQQSVQETASWQRVERALATPLTDAAEFPAKWPTTILCYDRGMVVHSNFARTLERANAALRASNGTYQQDFADAQGEIVKLRAEVERLKELVNRAEKRMNDEIGATNLSIDPLLRSATSGSNAPNALRPCLCVQFQRCTKTDAGCWSMKSSPF